jgi:putative phosphoesterase
LLIAVVSDTHLPRGRRRLPDECTDAIRGSDLLVHAGDVSTAAALADLRRIGPPVRAVHGNVDDADLARQLPERLELSLGDVDLGLIHDAGATSGRVCRLRGLFPRAAAVIFGHTHAPHHKAGDDGFQIFNPGSPTERRRAPRRSMGMAEIRGAQIQFRLIHL